MNAKKNLKISKKKIQKARNNSVVLRHLNVGTDLEMQSLKIFNANYANLANVAKKT